EAAADPLGGPRSGWRGRKPSLLAMTCARRFHPVPLALAALCSFVLGCYQPGVLDGGFKCNMKTGSKACPDGFTCGKLDGMCWRAPNNDAGSDDTNRDMGGVDIPDAG